MNYFPKLRGARLLAVTTISLLGIATGSSLSASATPLISTGLRNLGNTCYMNAQLECAFHIPAVRRITLAQDEQPETIVDDELDEEESSPDEEESSPESVKAPEVSEALIAMQELISEMEDAALKNYPPTTPRSFCSRLGIPVMVQQDSQEFWKLLLPALNKESLSDLYKGCFEDYITALDGSGREKRQQELFLDLSLDIASR
jgi:hypothetical protein